MRRKVIRASWPTVAVLAALGAVCLLVGIGLRTVWLPSSSYKATATIPAGAPLIVTDPGMPELLPGPVQIVAKGSPAQTVFIGRAREADVAAWVGRGAHATLTGLAADHRVGVGVVKGETNVPDPATAQIWVDSVSSPGTANYTYRDTTGRYCLVFGTVGSKGAPTTVEFIWPRSVVTPWVLPLFVAGGILLLAAMLLAVRVFASSRLAEAREVAGGLRPADDTSSRTPDDTTVVEPVRSPEETAEVRRTSAVEETTEVRRVTGDAEGGS